MALRSLAYSNSSRRIGCLPMSARANRDHSISLHGEAVENYPVCIYLFYTNISSVL
jgi:hypothetical protein